MPKIGNINLKYQGDAYITHEIHYRQGEGFSIKGFSDEFIGITGFNTYGYQTEHDLVNTVEAACRKYRELKTTAKWVILYKCEASSELRMNKIKEGEFHGLLQGVSNKIGNDTTLGGCLAAFGIDYIIAQVIDDGVKKKFYKIDKLTKKVSEWEVKTVKNYQEMDYTEEREQFFLNIIEKMKKIVVSASRFFGEDPEKAAMLIESNLKIIDNQ